MSTVNVRYIGLKDRETDRRGGTGLTWIGHGAVHAVPVAAWVKYLSKHPDVWELVAESEPGPTSSLGLGDAKLPAATDEALPAKPAKAVSGKKAQG